MRTIVGLLLIIIGISALTGIHLSRFFFSLLIILVGLRIISGRSWKNSDFSYPAHPVIHGSDYLNEVTIFSPVRKLIKSDKFKGGKIVVIFGGGEIDLSKVKAAGNNLDLELVAIFGGLKLIIPAAWKVKSAGMGIAGGFDNQAAKGIGPVTLDLKGVAIFGGVQIVS